MKYVLETLEEKMKKLNDDLHSKDLVIQALMKQLEDLKKENETLKNGAFEKRCAE